MSGAVPDGARPSAYHGPSPSERQISTASSFPNNDPIFGGAFIGDYEAMVATSTAHPIWTDLRGPSFAQNAMVYSP